MDKNIQDMPKVVLHLHLDGSLRPESVQRWLQKQGITKSLEEVTQNLRVDKDCKDLNQYLQKFDLPAQVLQEPENIEEATYELFEDLSKQNVVYAEVRFAPTKHMENGLSCNEVVAAAIRGMERAKVKYGIDGSLILCCIRGAVDLAGAEALFPTKDYKHIFEIAKKEGIPYTIHAGEADGPESIKSALEFEAKRIGHGVRSIEDKDLMDILRIMEIPLEVCPISNIQTQAVKGKHPLEELYRRGLFITINTDNNTVSDTNILEEYEWVLANTSLTCDDLLQMNKNAARFIFAPAVKRAEITAKIEAFKNREDKGLNK